MYARVLKVNVVVAAARHMANFMATNTNYNYKNNSSNSGGCGSNDNSSSGSYTNNNSKVYHANKPEGKTQLQP